MSTWADNLLARCRFTRAELAAAVAAARPATLDEFAHEAEAMRRAAIAADKGPRGRRGPLPDKIVRAIYADYLRTRSTLKTGRLYGRSKEAIAMLFHRRGLPLLPRNVLPKIAHGGRLYARSGGYYRDTLTREPLLRVLWRERHGEIPPGHLVTTADGDRENFAPENLLCLPRGETGRRDRLRHLGRIAA